jgi:hypothetical protein
MVKCISGLCVNNLIHYNYLFQENRCFLSDGKWQGFSSWYNRPLMREKHPGAWMKLSHK